MVRSMASRLTEATPARRADSHRSPYDQLVGLEDEDPEFDWDEVKDALDEVEWSLVSDKKTREERCTASSLNDAGVPFPAIGRVIERCL